jgi:hypothetical protein
MVRSRKSGEREYMITFYQKTVPRRASPFLRWSLSPFLLLFAVVFLIPLQEAVDELRWEGVIATSFVIILCIAGFLTLWGVPFVGRIVTGIIAFSYGWYVVDQCFIHFDGNWGWGGRRGTASPVNSILGFLVFGLPCLIHTIFGRFTIRKQPDPPEDLMAYDDEDDPEWEEENREGPGKEK